MRRVFPSVVVLGLVACGAAPSGEEAAALAVDAGPAVYGFDDDWRSAPVQPTPDDPATCTQPVVAPPLEFPTATRPCTKTLHWKGEAFPSSYRYDQTGTLAYAEETSPWAPHERRYRRTTIGNLVVEDDTRDGATTHTETLYQNGKPRRAVVGGTTREWLYDLAGRESRQQVTDASGQLVDEVRTYYDQAGRAYYVTHGLGHHPDERLHTFYSAGGVKSARHGNAWTQDAGGAEYDPCGRPTSGWASRDGEGDGTTSSRYDASGHLLEELSRWVGGDFMKSRTRYETDVDGRVLRSQQDGHSSIEGAWTHDTIYSRDVAHHLVEERVDGVVARRWRYDGQGRLVEEDDGQQRTTYSYDGCTE